MNTATKKDGSPEAMPAAELETCKNQLHGSWEVVNNQRLHKEFKFPDFKQALDFTNQVGNAAEQIGHHPDIYLGYGEVKLDIWTHSAGGLTKDDFKLATRVNELK